MKRRDFIEKTGYGMAGAFATYSGIITDETNTSQKNSNKMNTKNPINVEIDFEKIRNDFPALKKYKAYLDTAFIGLMPKQVKTAHEVFLKERLEHGPFPADQSILGFWMDKMEKVRDKLAVFLGAESDEIAFTYCTGCGSNIAINGIDWQKGDNVIIDDLEYPTDFHVLNALKKRGVEVRIAKHENGKVSAEKFEALLDKKSRAIVVSHVSYLNGFRHDLKKLADLIHANKGYLIVDSAQAIGGLKVDVKKENVDFMSGIPYKWLNGPNGVGFLYVKKEIIPLFSPDRLGWASTNDFVSLETMESNPLPKTARRFEYGTLSFEGIYALDSVLDYINKIGIENIENRNLHLIKILRENLKNLNVNFFTPENNYAPILTFYIDNEKEFGMKMRKNGIYVTARKWDKGHVRISPHFYNNENDIQLFCDIFSKVRIK